jgi:hypothetical protein
VSSTARPDRRRLILFGVAAAVLLGVVFALLMRPDLDRNRETTVAQRGAAQEGGREQLSFDVKPAREPYRAPDRDAISQAYSQAAKVFATEGVSGLARYGLECFRTLERRTTYRQLDYCLAFDAFGAAHQPAGLGRPAAAAGKLLRPVVEPPPERGGSRRGRGGGRQRPADRHPPHRHRGGAPVRSGRGRQCRGYGLRRASRHGGRLRGFRRAPASRLRARGKCSGSG